MLLKNHCMLDLEVRKEMCESDANCFCVILIGPSCNMTLFKSKNLELASVSTLMNE